MHLIGLKAIAKYMGVSVSTIRRWHKKLGLPLVKIDRKTAKRLAELNSKIRDEEIHDN